MSGENKPDISAKQIKKGEVYLYWIGKKEAKGTEINKIRPGVIISTNNLNKWNYRFIVAPITKRTKTFLDFEVPVMVNGKEGLAILDQIKTVDKSRLIKKLGNLTEKEMSEIRKKVDLVFD
ncbi:MAG: type II toxin-antitoxin system PemK/MazF family toxin [Candidatus Moeniiplasma glomeromycotorum]|nr:type II toxin-antitoxin system PemK/MazF family toxin [Candidatus Moeniiplasma glomeromycotorum]